MHARSRAAIGHRSTTHPLTGSVLVECRPPSLSRWAQTWHPDTGIAKIKVEGRVAEAVLRGAAEASVLVIAASDKQGDATRRPEIIRSHPGVVVSVPSQQFGSSELGRIIAGLDGSPESEEALGFALARGRLLGLPVMVVAVWTPPSLLRRWSLPAAYASLGNFTERMSVVLHRAQLGHPGVEAHLHVVEGDACEELRRLCEPQDLLVLGPRGLGGNLGALLGRVSSDLSAKPPCAVAVVAEHPWPPR